jgi:hypothetical protein
MIEAAVVIPRVRAFWTSHLSLTSQSRATLRLNGRAAKSCSSTRDSSSRRQRSWAIRFGRRRAVFTMDSFRSISLNGRSGARPTEGLSTTRGVQLWCRDFSETGPVFDRRMSLIRNISIGPKDRRTWCASQGQNCALGALWGYLAFATLVRLHFLATHGHRVDRRK